MSSGSESQITPSKSSATTSEDIINVLVRCLAALWIVRGHDDQPADSESMPGAAAETKRDIETKTKDVCLWYFRYYKISVEFSLFTHISSKISVDFFFRFSRQEGWHLMGACHTASAKTMLFILWITSAP